jgi:hypothetical protein
MSKVVYFDRGYRAGYYSAFVDLSKKLAVALPPEEYAQIYHAFIQPVLDAYDPPKEEY